MKVGDVTDVELVEGRAVATLNGRDTTAAELEIEPEYAPINSDARAIIRQKTLQGEAYVELTPGSGTVPSVPGGEEAAVALGSAANVSGAEADAIEPLPEGGELAVGAGEEAIQFDEILNAFDEETRAATRSLTATGARALRGRGTRERVPRSSPTPTSGSPEACPRSRTSRPPPRPARPLPLQPG